MYCYFGKGAKQAVEFILDRLYLVLGDGRKHSGICVFAFTFVNTASHFAQGILLGLGNDCRNSEVCFRERLAANYKESPA